MIYKFEYQIQLKLANMKKSIILIAVGSGNDENNSSEGAINGTSETTLCEKQLQQPLWRRLDRQNVHQNGGLVAVNAIKY